MMSDQSAWEQQEKISSLARQRDRDLAFLWNVSQGIELPYTVTLRKRNKTRQQRENQLLLLSKIEAAPW